MAIRTCPLCMARVPPGMVATYSDGVGCPGCKRQLEVSAGSRMLATTLGLLAAALVWRLTRSAGGMLGWVLPMVYAFFAFSVVAPAFLMLTADLRLKPAATETEPAVGHGHAGAHH